jgi:hypothetical protein
MADYEGALPVKTARDGEVVAAIVDGAGVNKLAVSATGEISAVVSATDLDIRDLSSTTDSVTVVATALDIRPLTNADVVTVEGAVTVSATDLDIRALDSAQDSVTVVASDLDVRDLTHVSDSVKIGDGVDLLAVNSDGSINVTITPQTVGLVDDYELSAAVGKDASVNFDYLVTSGKLFVGDYIIVGSRTEVEVIWGTYNGTTFTPKGRALQNRAMNGAIPIPALTLTGNGTDVIRVTVKNFDNTTDISCTIQGQER